MTTSLNIVIILLQMVSIREARLAQFVIIQPRAMLVGVFFNYIIVHMHFCGSQGTVQEINLEKYVKLFLISYIYIYIYKLLTNATRAMQIVKSKVIYICSAHDGILIRH